MNDLPPATCIQYIQTHTSHFIRFRLIWLSFLLVIRYHHDDMKMDRTPCVVHTIQLVVVHMLQKETTVKRVLDKARSVVKLFRKSSVATQRVLDQCGLIVVNDCLTRWSSTFNMVTQLLTVKDAVCQIASDMGWDSLLTSEWQNLFSCMNYCCLLRNTLKPSRVTPHLCP